ncbi:MAG: hypothetical protein ACHQ8D_15325 [Candidatus Rokuibacteriota bacterium]
MQTGLLPRFFESVTRQAFGDLAIDDAPALRYLTELLIRFVRTETLRTLRELPGPRLDSVTDSLLEIQHVWDWQAPGFNPGTERALRRQIGDYTLFMTGIFRDYVDRLAVTGYYEHEGRRAYRFVAELARARAEVDASLYRRLAERFEMYAGALTYTRKVYFRADAVPAAAWPADPLFRALLAE